LAHDHARGLAAEEFIQRAAVDDDVARARTHEDARGGGLAAAGSVILCACHLDWFLFDLVRSRRVVVQISSACGCCAVCLCSGPAKTLSLRNIARPSGFFGSMPFTASSMTFSG